MSHGHCGIVKAASTPKSLGAAARDAMNTARVVAVRNREEKKKAIEALATVVTRAAQVEFEIDNDASSNSWPAPQYRLLAPASTSLPLRI